MVFSPLAEEVMGFLFRGACEFMGKSRAKLIWVEKMLIVAKRGHTDTKEDERKSLEKWAENASSLQSSSRNQLYWLWHRMIAVESGKKKLGGSRRIQWHRGERLLIQKLSAFWVTKLWCMEIQSDYATSRALRVPAVLDSWSPATLHPKERRGKRPQKGCSNLFSTPPQSLFSAAFPFRFRLQKILSLLGGVWKAFKALGAVIHSLVF